MNIRTILFDLDGTLIDTNELIIQSFLHTFRQYGFTFTREEVKAFNGPPLKKTFEAIDPQRADEMIQTYLKHNHAIHDHYVKAFPNVVETIQQLREHQINMGIVTTKMRKGALMGLRKTGLDRLFETVITLNDVKQAKPHPEPVLKAMNELGGEAESTLMVGDNSYDIEAGHNAGMYTAGVAWSQRGKAYLQQYQPTYMLENMKDLLKLPIIHE
ncbi:MAG TPA: pyrophosphatase PpaX [Bacillota bacterium]|nr:pyrophosphatase PpaX [Bacillota bacterium]